MTSCVFSHPSEPFIEATHKVERSDGVTYEGVCHGHARALAIWAMESASFSVTITKLEGATDAKD